MGSTEGNTTHIYITKVLTWFPRLKKYPSHVLLFLFGFVFFLFVFVFVIEKSEIPFELFFIFYQKTGKKNLQTNICRVTQCQPHYTRQSFCLHSSLKHFYIPVRQISLTESYCAIRLKMIMMK